jgi:very-short-patch-repair endonuclease
MPYIYNLHRQTQLRRRLRNAPTKTEYILWQRLRRRQVMSLKFRRQYGIRDYVVDFYCPQLKLAIEIDGAPHEFFQQRQHDNQRQQKLQALGIHMIRFTNNDVLVDIDKVINAIRATAIKIDPKTNITTPRPS